MEEKSSIEEKDMMEEKSSIEVKNSIQEKDSMEEKNSHLLSTPVEKENCKSKREYPFPIVTPECKPNEADPNWKIHVGYLQKDCVLVHDQQSVKMLYSMGYFGKGTSSEDAPKIYYQESTESVKQMPKSATSSQVGDVIDVVASGDKGSKPNKLPTSNEDEDDDVLIAEDSPDIGKVYPKLFDTEEKESLQLTFEEAFYLSYALGCLLVKDKDQPLTILKLWRKLVDQTEALTFPIKYTAYHHLKSKGWIVRSGMKYGTDYILYKDGPPFHHATYSVLVRALKENLEELKGNRELTWRSLTALGRVHRAAGMGLIILNVIKPYSMIGLIPLSPACVPDLKIEAVLYKQFVPGEDEE